MNLYYEASIKDKDEDVVIAMVGGYSMESLEEEMGKSKWTEAVKRYEENKKEELNLINEE